MPHSDEGTIMSTANSKRTSTRGASRKRKDADGPAADSPVPNAPAVDVAANGDASIDSAAVDLPSADLPPNETEHEIRIRAYELYLLRGGADGDDLSDWLEAERLVRSSQRSSDDEQRENRSSPPA